MFKGFFNRIGKLETELTAVKKRGEEIEIVCRRLTVASDLLLKAIEINVTAISILEERLRMAEQRIAQSAYIQ